MSPHGNEHSGVLFYGLGPYFLRQKMEKMRTRKGQKDRKVNIPRQKRYFFLVESTIQVLFPRLLQNRFQLYSKLLPNYGFNSV